MSCSSCGFENPIYARYCGRCGAPQRPPISVTQGGTAAVTQVNTNSLGSEARRLSDLIVSPIATELRAIKGKGGSSQEQSARTFINQEILGTLVHFACTGGAITPNHGELFVAICGTLEPRKFGKYSREDGKRFMDAPLKATPQYRELKKPFCYGILENYDVENGTSFHTQLRELYVGIAVAAISANGSRTAEASAELERFKVLLAPTDSIRRQGLGTTNQEAAFANGHWIKSDKEKEVVRLPEKSDKLKVGKPTAHVEVSDSQSLEGVAWRLLNIAAELDEPIRRMTEHAKIIGQGGKEQKFTTLKDWVHFDLYYLFSRFSMKDPQVATRRACLLAQITAIFNATDPTLYSKPSELNKPVVQAHSDLIRNAQAGDLGYNPGREVNTSSFTAFQLVQKYDELVGTRNAERVATQYLSAVKAVAAADDDEDSRATLAKIEAVLCPARAEAKPSQQKDSLDDLFKRLNGLVGLSRVKADVNQLVNYIKVQQLRKQQHLKTPDLSLHVVFYGNPGTGKTTVARLIAQLYRALGVLSKGQLVETDRSGLVAGYVGQTALKVKEVVERALGGVLFIDEAYSLKPVSGTNDYGDEAIDALIKLMEDHRDDLVVVVAGYTAPMERFLEANPGLKSRFNKYLVFEDYSSIQLLEIFRGFCEQSDYSVSKDAEAKLLRLFQEAYSKRDETFGNARLARNVFELAIANLASRIVSLERPERANLQLIEASDVELPEGLTVPEKRMGFSAK